VVLTSAVEAEMTTPVWLSSSVVAVAAMLVIKGRQDSPGCLEGASTRFGGAAAGGEFVATQWQRQQRRIVCGARRYLVVCAVSG
jgi:hypothetical protein